MPAFWSRVFLILSAVCLTLPGTRVPLGAQQKGAMEVGARVRVHTSTLTVVGDVDRLSEGGLSLSPEGQDTLSFQWPEVALLELSVVDGHHAKRGAVIGFGAAILYVIGYAASWEGDMSPGGVFALGSVLYGLPAAAIGALVGSRIPKRSWREIPVPGTGS